MVQGTEAQMIESGTAACQDGPAASTRVGGGLVAVTSWFRCNIESVQTNFDKLVQCLHWLIKIGHTGYPWLHLIEEVRVEDSESILARFALRFWVNSAPWIEAVLKQNQSSQSQKRITVKTRLNHNTSLRRSGKTTSILRVFLLWRRNSKTDLIQWNSILDGNTNQFWSMIRLWFDVESLTLTSPNDSLVVQEPDVPGTLWLAGQLGSKTGGWWKLMEINVAIFTWDWVIVKALDKGFQNHLRTNESMER